MPINMINANPVALNHPTTVTLLVFQIYLD